jgi:hypothetical protein
MASGRDIRAGGAFVELYAKDEKLRETLRRAQARVNTWGKRVRNIGASVAVAGAALAAPLAAASRTFATYGDQLNKAAIRTGFSTEALSELGFAAEQSGASFEDLVGAVLRANRRLGRIAGGLGSGQQLAAVEALGLTGEQLAAMSPEQRLYALADAMSGFEDATTAAGLAQRAFGTQVDAILPLLLQGSAGIDALRGEARDLGLSVTGDSAALAAALTDSLNIVRRLVRDLAFSVGQSFAPAVIAANEAVGNAVQLVTGFIDRNRALVAGLAAAIAGVVGIGTAMVAAGVGVQLIAFSLGGLATVLGLVGAAAAVVSLPLVAIAAAIAAAVVAVVRYTPVLDMLRDSFAAVSGVARDVVGSVAEAGRAIVDALSAGEAELAANVLGATIAASIAEAGFKIQTGWSETMLALEIVSRKAAHAIANTFRGMTVGIIEQLDGLLEALADAGRISGGLLGIGGAAAAGIRGVLAGAAAGARLAMTRPIDLSDIPTRRAAGITDAAAARDLARSALDAAVAASGRAATRAESRRAAALEAMEEQQAAAISSATAATFGGSLASRVLNGQSSAANRTATATERTAEAVERIERDRSSGLVFR